MQNPTGEGGSMRRRALLAVFVALLVIGAYGVYVVSYPRYPEVNDCVNPFAVTKPVSRIQCVFTMHVAGVPIVVEGLQAHKGG